MVILEIERLTGLVRSAVQDYNMINNGDRIAVGVSGGKDSMALLTALAKLRSYYPFNFEIEAVTLNLGIGEFDTTPIRQYCEALDVPYTVEETLIGKIVFDVRKEENPCSMCANLRRGALNNAALKLGCSKVALAHSCDDLIETFLLSMFYEGRLHTFSPVTHLKRTKLDLIRPLSYVWEKDVKGFINKYKIITVPNPCTAAGHSARTSVGDMLAALAKENRKVKYNILGAIKRAGIDGWRET